jgi:hypothetical protein
LNEHIAERGDKLGFEGIVSKRLGSGLEGVESKQETPAA